MSRLEDLVVSSDWKAGYEKGLADGKTHVKELLEVVERHEERIKKLEELLEDRLIEMHAEAVVAQLERLLKWIEKQRKEFEPTRDSLWESNPSQARWWDARCLQLSEVRNYVRRMIRTLKRNKKEVRSDGS
ncbi:MAG: hypothetical protein JRD89_00915 [Deltaproteobacteria bacterium]|nr:hypothetical protein [Deltaproteobacteria bacterium]